jgi:hypothetical protein
MANLLGTSTGALECIGGVGCRVSLHDHIFMYLKNLDALNEGSPVGTRSTITATKDIVHDDETELGTCAAAT